MFGVILLGIFAICLAVSMPTDLEFSEATIPSSGAIVSSSESSGDVPSIISGKNSTVRTSNLTSSRRTVVNQEDSVETKILMNLAIQKAIREQKDELSQNSISQESPLLVGSGDGEDLDGSPERQKVTQIVEAFVASEDFEDFIIDVEINDAIKKLRKQKGYKKRENTIFDDLFARIEKEFLGESDNNPKEMRLIKLVGQEMERRAKEVIIARKKLQGEDASYEEAMLIDAASELYLEYDDNNNINVSGDSENKDKGDDNDDMSNKEG